jgi:hypothetical protein
VFESAAPSPPALIDESGTVLIDPRLLSDVPNLDDPVVTELSMRVLSRDSADTWATVVPRHLIADLRGYESLRLWETRLVAGKRAYALGTTGRDRDGFVLRPAGFSVFTTDDVGAVLLRRHQNVASSRQLARVFGLFGAVITIASVAALFWLV